MAIVSTSNAERLTAGCLLSCIGGFLDVYTYLYRGEVFANAVTGNLVLLGLAVARWQWSFALKYLIAIVAYAAGVGLAEIIRSRTVPIKALSWQQVILIVEFFCLLPVPFIPYGDGDFIV
ncbi:MAG: YoaK family protein, partial [Victivallaceae bacterium]